ncbi:MAG: peptidoglycan DD-metalloendopeptidase family protein [Nitrospiraceae bacterium]|nr:peptidoglycan DD-metalloendopeptidase family protein [Nitrospiraceae bacterium]
MTGYGSLTWHDHGLVHEVQHANGVKDWYPKDPHGMGRPADVWVQTPGRPAAHIGPHFYDGQGNLVRQQKVDGRGFDSLWPEPTRATNCQVDVCDNYYLYDLVGRLTKFNESGGMWQEYGYDRYGNLIERKRYDGSSVTTQSWNVSPSSNQLTSLLGYDPYGSVTSRYLGTSTEIYERDDFDQIASRNFPSETHLYTADGERVWTLRFLGPGPLTQETYTLRDLDGRLLTTYELSSQNGSETWMWSKDHIYRGSALLATATNEPAPRNVQHFTLDHLGTPRVTTDAAGNVVAVHHYWAYGEELAGTPNDPERLRFTGHERDGLSTPDARDDLDYMHARYCSPDLGRFSSVDPAKSAKPGLPQSWNRYSYVRNNPLSNTDPDGARQNPVTGGTGIEEAPENGTFGRIRSNADNREVGLFGWTRNRGTRFHPGIDINAPSGTPVYAAEAGTVTLRPNLGDAGNRLDIALASGETLVYAHLDSYLAGLSSGDAVLEGEIVGYSGTTGNAAGFPADEEHLHFSVIDADDQRVDPMAWLNDPTAPPPANGTPWQNFQDEANRCQCTPAQPL